MIPAIQDRLYRLLPATYRVGDAAQGEVLRALAAVLQQEFQILQDDIDQLYDNWFIETCDEWVVPYIGDLLGVRGLMPTVEGSPFTQRAIVANTLAYRRRKGTAAVLERLARDVSGWPARTIEFFQLLATTQNLNHVRLQNLWTVNVRDASQAELAGTPLETAAHTGEVRHIDNERGKYNVRNVGLFLWRLQDYAVYRSVARAVGPVAGCFTFSPLGNDAPLFNTPRTEVDITDRTGERNLPTPLRRRALNDELNARTHDDALKRTGYFGDPPVLQVLVDGVAVPPERLAVCDLSDPRVALADHWRRPGADADVGVDPVLGRFALRTDSTKRPTPKPKKVEVSFSYGFSGDLGGGPYDQRAALAAVLKPGDQPGWQLGVTIAAPPLVSGAPPPPPPDIVPSLADAIDAWNASQATLGLIALMDSATYGDPTPPLPPPPVIEIGAGRTLLIIAADWPEEDVPGLVGVKQREPGRITPGGRRPHQIGDLAVLGTASKDSPKPPGSLVIHGLLLEGKLVVAPGNLGTLRLAHSTLVPQGATPTLHVFGEQAAGQGNERLTVMVDRSISGAIAVAQTIQRLTLSDCVVDAVQPGETQGTALIAADTTINTSTILGSANVRTMESSNSIFTGLVHVTRRQAGCVRFSYLPPGSIAPRRFHCQPTTGSGLSPVSPRFTSVTYGHPGFAQLAPSCPPEITDGADDEGEMGVFHFLQQRRRIHHLAASLNEYLRFGLEAGIFLVT